MSKNSKTRTGKVTAKEKRKVMDVALRKRTASMMEIYRAIQIEKRLQEEQNSKKPQGLEGI